MPRIQWTSLSINDLAAIREFIARDAPLTADRYVQRLRQATKRLRRFPYSGAIVPELGRENVREVLFGNYRIIYRIDRDSLKILTVYHAARLLDETVFE